MDGIEETTAPVEPLEPAPPGAAPTVDESIREPASLQGDRARAAEAGGQIIPPPPEPQAGSPEVTPVPQMNLPSQPKVVPKLNASRKYVQHRQAAHSDAAREAFLDKELGLDSEAAPAAPATPAEATPGIGQMLADWTIDGAKQLPIGAVNGVQELGNTLLDLGDWAEKLAAKAGLGSGDKLENFLGSVGASQADRNSSGGLATLALGDAETGAGRMAEGIGRFAVGFLPTSRLMQGVKLVKYANTMRFVKAAASGAVTDFAFFDPHSQRLSNLVQEYPLLANPVTKYLAADPKDTNIDGRLKASLEGLGVGVMADGLIAGLKWLKGSNQLKAAAKGGAPVVSTEVKAATAGGEAVNPRPASGTVEAAGASSPATKGSINESDRALQESIAARQKNVDAAQAVNSGASRPDAVADEIVEAVKPVDAPVGELQPGQGNVAEGLPATTGKPGETMAPSATGEGPAIRMGKDGIEVNPAAIDVDTDVQGLVRQATEARAGGATREATDLQAQAYADALAFNVDDLRNLKPGRVLNADEVDVGFDLVTRAGQEAEAAAQKAVASNSPDDKAAAQEAIDGFMVLIKKLSEASSESGGSLKAFDRTNAPAGTFRMNQEQRKLFLALRNEADVDKVLQFFANAKDPKEKAKFVRLSMMRRMSDVAHFSYINGLLGGARTIAVNVVGNTVNTALKVAQTGVAEVLGQLPAAQRLAISSGNIAAGETRALIDGWIGGMGDAFRMAKEQYKGRLPIGELTPVSVVKRNPISSENFDVHPIAGKVLDFIGNSVVAQPTRISTAADMFGKSVNYRMSLQAQAHREASFRGLLGEERNAFIKDVITSPPEEMMLKAIDDADVTTFNSELSAGMEAFVRAAHNPDTVGGQIGRFVIPFLRTNFNVTLAALEMMPGASYISPRFRADLAAGGARADLAKAKVAMGSTVMATAAALFGQGIITGKGPADFKVRKDKEATGWRPYSILVNGEYKSYSKVDPFGRLMGTAADLAEVAGQTINQEKTIGDAAMHAIAIMGDTLSTERLIDSVTDLLDVIKEPDNPKKTGTFFANLAAGFVPNQVAQFNRQGGDVKRSTDSRQFALNESLGKYQVDNFTFLDGLVNRIRSKVPGLSDDLPAKRNRFGEAEVYDKGWGADIGIPVVGPLADLLSPVYVSKMNDSPIRKEIARLTASGREFVEASPFISLKGGSIPLTPKEFDRFQELSGGQGLYKAVKDAARQGKTTKDPESFRMSLEERLNWELKNNFPTTVATNPMMKKTDQWKHDMINAIMLDYINAAKGIMGSETGTALPERYEALRRVKEKSTVGDRSKSVIGPGGSR